MPHECTPIHACIWVYVLKCMHACAWCICMYDCVNVCLVNKCACLCMHAGQEKAATWEVLPCFSASSTVAGSHLECSSFSSQDTYIMAEGRRLWRRLRENKIAKIPLLMSKTRTPHVMISRCRVQGVSSLTTKFGSQRDTGSNPVSSPTEFHGLVPESSLSLGLAACTVQ